jgi:hypothetical protein
MVEAMSIKLPQLADADLAMAKIYGKKLPGLPGFYHHGDVIQVDVLEYCVARGIPPTIANLAQVAREIHDGVKRMGFAAEPPAAVPLVGEN